MIIYVAISSFSDRHIELHSYVCAVWCDTHVGMVGYTWVYCVTHVYTM